MKTLLLTILFCLITTFSYSAELTYKICEPNTWMGTVQWEGVPGPNTEYKLRDDIQLKEIGEKTFTVDEGWYGITVYDPFANVIRDYVNVHVTDNKKTKVVFCGR